MDASNSLPRLCAGLSAWSMCRTAPSFASQGVQCSSFWVLIRPLEGCTLCGMRRSPLLRPGACLQVELESVRPDSGDEELRLRVSSLPLRLRIDQDVVTFLQTFFAADGPAAEIAAPATREQSPPDGEPAAQENSGEPRGALCGSCNIPSTAVGAQGRCRRGTRCTVPAICSPVRLP